MLKKVAIHGMSPTQFTRDYHGAQLIATSGINTNDQVQITQINPSIKHYANLDELLNHEKPEIVSICSSKNAFQDIKTAHKHGVTIIAEKPITQNDEELKELDEMGKTTPIYPLMPYFYHPCLQAVKEIIELNEIGEICHIDIYKSFSPESETILLSGIQHLISSLYWGVLFNLGEPEIRNVTSNRIGGPQSLNLNCLLKYSSQTTLNIHLNTFELENSENYNQERVQILGTNGIIEIQNLASLKVLLKNGDQREETGFEIEDSSFLAQQFFDSVINNTEKDLTPKENFQLSKIALKICSDLEQ